MSGAASASGVLVVPAHNEESALPRLVDDITASLAGALPDVDLSVLVVDDGSTDRTAAVLEALAATTAGAPIPVAFLSLSRNFGHQAAIVAGMLHASAIADFVVTLDADGEHPVALVRDMVEHWRHGAAIVHTVRRPNLRLPWRKRTPSAAYYWLLAKLSGLPVRPGMADFKLWDGALLRQVASALPHCGSTRAFASWLAPGGPIVTYDQNVVEGRESRFTLRKMMSLAVGSIVRYSDLPLRISILVGVVALLFAAVLSAFVLWATFTGRTIVGWASTMLTVTIFGGLQSFSIGILGEYLLRNWFRRTLPAYVVRERSSRSASRTSSTQP